jgi:hypothetical protein
VKLSGLELELESSPDEVMLMDYLWTTYAMGSPQRKYSLQESNQEIADRSVHIHTQEFVLRRISSCS